MNTAPIVVYTANGQLEAQMLKLLLESNGIPAQTSQESVGLTYGLTIGKLGAVDLLVPASYEGPARELLDAYERGDLELDEDSAPPDPDSEE